MSIIHSSKHKQCVLIVLEELERDPDVPDDDIEIEEDEEEEK